MQKRFVSWAAVSSLPQAKKISLTEQRAINLQHIERYDGQLVADLVVDESRDIPELSEACERIEAYSVLRELIKSGGCDVVVCYTRSRLGRVAALVETIAEICRRSGVAIYETDTPPANLDAKGSDSDLLSGMVRSWGAQREVDELKQRNKMGMIGRIRRGDFVHKAPWGWHEHYTPDGKVEHTVDLQAQATLEIVADLYLNYGWGSEAIAKELMARGIPAPQGERWNKTTVQQMFYRIWLFAGYTSINRITTTDRPFTQNKGKFPPLISEELAAKIANERDRRVKARRSVGSKHLFSQCVWCEACGRCMIAEWARRELASGEVHYERYDCRSRHPGRQITNKKIAAAVHDAIIFAQKKANRQKILEMAATASPSVEDDIKRVNKKIAELQKSIERADDAYVAGSMSIERYKRQAKRISEEIAENERELTNLAQQRQAREQDMLLEQRLEEIANEGMEMLNNPDVPIANAWMRRHFKVIMRDGEVYRVVYI